MSLESIRKVTMAESEAVAKRAQAEAEVKKILADAEREGREKLEKTRDSAEAEVKRLMDGAIKEADAHAKEITKKSLESCNALKANAEKQIPKAAAVIVERIVSPKCR